VRITSKQIVAEREGLEPPIVVLFFSDQPPTIGRLNVFHSPSYTNPRLQARVLPARSEMVTTLIALIVRFARPNIQIYDARVVDLYQWVCARYRVGVKGAETKAKRN